MQTATETTEQEQAELEYRVAESAWQTAQQNLRDYFNSTVLRCLKAEEHAARVRRNAALQRRAEIRGGRA